MVNVYCQYRRQFPYRTFTHSWLDTPLGRVETAHSGIVWRIHPPFHIQHRHLGDDTPGYTALALILMPQPASFSVWAPAFSGAWRCRRRVCRENSLFLSPFFHLYHLKAEMKRDLTGRAWHPCRAFPVLLVAHPTVSMIFHSVITAVLLCSRAISASTLHRSDSSPLYISSRPQYSSRWWVMLLTSGPLSTASLPVCAAHRRHHPAGLAPRSPGCSWRFYGWHRIGHSPSRGIAHHLARRP